MAKFPHYTFTGINRDVNPFIMNDAELVLSRNFYTPIYGSKKVRFGYNLFLDNPDSSPVRNLIYFNPPGGTPQIIRISGEKTYSYAMSGSTWGSNVNTWTVDTVTAKAVMAGLNGTYLHLSNGADPYTTYNGSTWRTWTSTSTPKPNYMTAYQGSIFCNAGITLAASAINFDVTHSDPWLETPSDPTSSGNLSLYGGKGGKIVGMSVVSNYPYIYTEHAIFRFNGTGIDQIPFEGYIFPNTAVNNMNGLGYVLTTNGIYQNSNQVTPANLGVNQIIYETMQKSGMNPFAFSFGQFTFYWIGQMNVGDDVYQNAMIVHDELFNLYDIWTLAHQMTSFGYFYDSNNRPILISGDVNGNTYRWGEEYSSDAGISIDYQLKTQYYHNGQPDDKETIDKISISTEDSGEAEISIAQDYQDEYEPVDYSSGYSSKSYVDTLFDPQSLSLQIAGSTTSGRPQLNGFTVTTLDSTPDNISSSKRK